MLPNNHLPSSLVNLLRINYQVLMSWLSISQLLSATSISIGVNFFLRKPGQSKPLGVKRLAQDALAICDDHFPGQSKSC